VYQLYFEDGYVESAYLTRVAEMSATFNVAAAVSAVGKKADGYYFEEDYITTGYFVYIARAEAALSPAFAVNCNTTFEEFIATLSSSFTQTAQGGKLVGFTINVSSTFTQTATGSRNADIDLFAFGNAQLAAAVSRIRDNNIAVSSTFSISVDVTRTRNLSSEDAAVFSAIINGLRSRDVNIQTQAAFSLTAQAQRTTDIVLSAFNNVSLTASAVVERRTGSSLSTTANITVDVARSRGVVSTLTTTASLSTLGERTRALQASLVAEYAITAQGQRTTDIILSAFTNGTVTATAIVNRTLISSQSASAALTVIGGLNIVASAPLTSTFALAGYLNVLVRNLPPTVNSGGIYNTAIIDNSVYKFGGGSLTWDEVTRAFPDSQPVVANNTFYFFQEGYTWSSSNGTTWTRAGNNLGADPSRTVSQVTFENGYFLFFNGTNLFYSTNGTTWTINSSLTSALSGFFTASNTVHYDGTSYYIFGRYESGPPTTKAGFISGAINSSWTKGQIDQGIIANDTYKSTSGVIVAYKTSSYNVITRRLIAGSGSIVLSGLSVSFTIRQVAYDAVNGHYVVIFNAEDGSGPKYIYRSTNGGSTWSQSSVTLPSAAINDLQLVNGTWFISTDIGLYTTDFSTLTKIHDYRVGTVLWNGTRFLSTLLDRPGFVITSTTAGSGWSVSQVDNISGVGGSLSYATGQLASTGTIDFWVNIVNEDNQIDLNRFGRQILRIRQDANNYLDIQTYSVFENDAIQVTKYIDGVSGIVYRVNFDYTGWIHIRFVQSGTSAALYINGERIANAGGNAGYSTSWPSGAITGPTEVLQRDVVWLDELLITTDVLVDPSVASFTVPTSNWLNTANTKLLLHFNDGFADDSRFQVIPEARLTATASMTVTSTVSYVESFALTATATLTVQGQRTTDIILSAFTNGALTANNERTRAYSSPLSSNAALTAINTRTREYSSPLSSSAALTAINGRTRPFDSSLSAFASTLTVAQETSGLTANLTAVFDTTQRYIEDGTFADGYFTTSQTNAIKTASANAALTATFALGADGDYFTNFSAALTTTASLTTAISVVRSASSSQSSQFAVAVTANKTTVTSAALTSTASLTANGIKGSEIALFAFTNAALTVNNQRTRATASSLTSTATFFVDTFNSLEQLGEAYVNAEFTQTTVNARIRSTSVSMQAFASTLTAAQETSGFSVNLTATFTQTTVNARTRSTSTALATTASLTATAVKVARGVVSITAAMTATMDVREIRTDTIVYVIPAEDWIYNIAAENRLYAINGETRVFTVYSESRIKTIAQETRILTIT
jgi:hypothetical protein